MTLDVTVRRVCRACNGGWLSDLEQRTKPLLEPLIAGRRRTLQPADIDAVALWCVKTALLFQFIHPDRRLAPDDHYRWLYERRTPPQNVFAWIAGYEGERWSGWYLHQILGLREPGGPDQGHRGYCSTATIGRLVFQVIGTDALNPLEVEKASEKEPYIAQMWPQKTRSTISLPPRLLLNDYSLPQFADPFGAVDPAGIVR